MKVFDNEPIDLVDLNFEWIVSTADIKHALEKAIDKINELVERVNKLPVECSCKEKPSTGQERTYSWTEVRDIINNAKPARKKECDCEDDDLVGIHTKDCDFYPKGWNESADKYRARLMMEINKSKEEVNYDDADEMTW